MYCNAKFDVHIKRLQVETIMAPPQIIAICGQMRSGKDTVAEYLCRNYGYTNVKIAENLKKSLGILFNFTEAQLEGDAKDQIDPYWGITPRNAMQFFGTEVMQYKIQELLPACNRTFWISTTVQSLENKLKVNQNSRYVISDLRFVHEYEYLKCRLPNVFIIKIERPKITSSALIAQSHVSEQEYKKIVEHHTLNNSGSLTDLYQQVQCMISNINQKQ